jgi:hypothetical protein
MAAPVGLVVDRPLSLAGMVDFLAAVVVVAAALPVDLAVLVGMAVSSSPRSFSVSYGGPIPPRKQRGRWLPPRR